MLHERRTCQNFEATFTLLSQNFINSETENRHEKLKKLVWWKKDSRRRHFVPEHSVLEFSAVITPRLAKRGSFSAIS